MSSRPSLADLIEVKAESASSLASKSHPGPGHELGAHRGTRQLTLETNVFPNLVRHLFAQTLLHSHLLLHLCPRRLS